MNSLILYFSRADENYGVGYLSIGNTEVLAKYIKDITGADSFKVERKIPYAKDYDTCIIEAKKEIENKEEVPLLNTLNSIDKYDVIYIGTPVYWSYMPAPLAVQIKKLDWHGKIVKPFITHEGSGKANILEELESLCKGATIKKAIAIYGSKVGSAKEIIESWVREDE